MMHYGLTVLGCIFIIIEFFVLLKRDKYNQNAPGILITTGILFTFVGISVGLFSFDANDVETGLPNLLGGIKTAFFASAFGVAGALVFKFIEAFFKPKNDITTGQTIDDIVSKQLEQIKQFETQNENFAKLLNSIGGDSDSSLVGQIKQLRIDFKDKIEQMQKSSDENSKELIKSFNDFATNMAENNSKAFIEALESTIKDFNTKISEQFGENFKQLNEAVSKTVEWQEQYRLQMQELISGMSSLFTKLEKQTSDYGIVVENSSNFEKHASNMNNVLNAILNQTSQLDTIINSLSSMVANVSDKLPLIGKETDEMIMRVSKSAESLTKTITENQDKLTDLVRKQIDNITENNEKIIANLVKNNDTTSRQLSDSMKLMTEEIKNQVIALDKELDNALKNSLEGLGQQLASLSNKFVSDYTPLTERLKEVVHLASSVKH